MRVLKFGGSSVGDAASVQRVVEVVRRRAAEPLLVVVSAVGDTTDLLDELGTSAAGGDLARALALAESLRRRHLELARALLPDGPQRDAIEHLCRTTVAELEGLARSLAVVGDLSAPVRDRLLGTGELLSSRVLVAALAAAGLPARWLDAREVVVTEPHHGGADPLPPAIAARCAELVRPRLETGQLLVTQGFVGRSTRGAATTLGRGGSDWTASLLGAALGAREIQIWTDVDGIMTADPSLVAEARSIPVMSFQEAAELAFYGARVLHPRTLLPAVAAGIPVRVLNTRRPDGEGTLILAEAPDHGPTVKSIAYKEGLTLVQLVSTRMFKAHDFLARLFEVFARHRLAPDVVATSEVSLAIGLSDATGLEPAVDHLRELGTVEVRPHQAVVCVVGERLKATPGVVADVFAELRDVRVGMVSQGGSEINLSFVVDEVDLPRVVRRLHQRFFPAAASVGPTAGGLRVSA